MQVHGVNHLAEDPIDRAIRLWQQRLPLLGFGHDDNLTCNS